MKDQEVIKRASDQTGSKLKLDLEKVSQTAHGDCYKYGPMWIQSIGKMHIKLPMSALTEYEITTEPGVEILNEEGALIDKINAIDKFYVGINRSMCVKNITLTLKEIKSQQAKSDVAQVCLNLYKITVNKRDSACKPTPVAGGEFRLIGKDGSPIGTSVTGKDGKAIFCNIYPGIYVLEETNGKGVEQEAISDSVLWIDTGNSDSTVNIYENTKKGIIEIYKFDQYNSDQGLIGAEFKVLDKSGQIADHITTDQYGFGFTKPLHFGEYFLQEIKSPKGYILDDTPIKATLTDINTSVKTIYIPNRRATK